MESEKLEDLLLLSLSASKGQEGTLGGSGCGSDQGQNLREVIVKYSGDIDGLQVIPGMEIQKLLAGLCNCKASGGFRSWSARGCPGDRICGDAEKSADRFV